MMFYPDLIFNLGLLIALSIVSGFLDKRFPRDTRLGMILQGALFGAVASIGMLRPLTLEPGLIFDGRSVMISLCALFFGPLGAAVSCVITLTRRAMMGGIGVYTSTLVILASAALGLLARHFWKPAVKPPDTGRLYLLGLVVHGVMLALMFALPSGMGLSVIKRIGLPIILLYPLATILAGKILSDRLSAKQTETMLEIEKQRLNYIIEGTNAGTWEWNIQTGETVFNERWAGIIGYALEELGPVSIATWERFTHPDDLQKSKDLLMRHFSGELPYYSCEARMRHKDGRWIWVLDRGKVSSRTKDGKPLMMQGTHVEITERKSTQDALADERNLYKDLVASQPAGVYRLRVVAQKAWSESEWVEKAKEHFRFELVNDRFCEILGATRKQCHDDATIVVERVHPDDRPEFDRRNAQALDDMQRFEWEGRLTDGKWTKWVYFASVPRRFEDGDVVWTGILLDLTERRQAERELRESEELFRNVFLHHAAVKLILDPETGHIIDANEAAAEFYGWSHEELLAMKISDINTLAPQDLQEAIKKVLDQERIRFEFRHRRADGSIRDVEVFSSTIEVKGQKLLHSIVNDITERKRAENEIRRLNEELEKEVARRTEELNKTIRQLEETNRGFVSRELKMIELKKKIEELENQ